MPGRPVGRPGRPPGGQPQPAPTPPQPTPPQPTPPPQPRPQGGVHPAGPIRHAGQQPARPPESPLSSVESEDQGENGWPYDPVPCVQELIGALLYGNDPNECIIAFLVCLAQSSNGAANPVELAMAAHRKVGGQHGGAGR